MGKNLKKLTILHSNDMHGDFVAKKVNEKLLGGVSMLSGYIQKTRKEDENVIYAISGDMFRGSVIDSEYKGISTIEIMNMLYPDVVTIGNHEVDYGVAHLLFIEKCAQFPIINANMYIKTNFKRLFRSHIILEIDGMKILFIGVLTEAVLSQTRQDNLIGALVDIEEAAKEVGRICDVYKTEDIDFTVLLTHIGIESDKELAAELDPRWGVDLIIGGHSHTYLEKPVEVCGIPIVQAACGTEQIGRFDIIVDTDLNAIDSYTWKLIPIDEEHCPRDLQLEEIVNGYCRKTDLKYKRLITRLADKYTHPRRNEETMLGRLIADSFQDMLGVDIMLLGSGSIRGENLGPIVTYQDLMEVFPYNEEIFRIWVSGEQLSRMIRYILREEVLSGEGEFYQFSKGFHVEYERSSRTLRSFSFQGRQICEKDRFKIGIQNFHLKNIKSFMGITEEELSGEHKPKVIATRCSDALEEYFSTQDMLRCSEERRLLII